MLYHVSRNGQNYGPYTLDDLRRYVASGNVMATDMARAEGTEQWLPVSEILGMPSAQSYAPPVYSSVPGGPMADPTLYPDPPNLAWGFVLLFNVLTCGLFMVVWNIVVSAWMRRVQPNSQAMLYYIGGAILSLSSSGTFMAMQRNHYHFSRHPPLGGLVFLASWVVRLIARYSMKASLEQHFNGPEPIGLRLSGVMTFFFGGLYHQYHLNRIVDIKNTLRYRGGLR